MSDEDLLVIAQCRRCGRGFLDYRPKMRDKYGYPGGDYPKCGGHVWKLDEPVRISEFKSYGKLLPPSPHPMNVDGGYDGK